MSKVSFIFFWAYYGLGTLLLPLGDLSYIGDLPLMYQHCADEDPNVDLTDFIFEHLMNIQDSDDADKNEKPHQPVFHHNPVQTPISVSLKIRVPASFFKPMPLKNDFPLMTSDPPILGYSSEIFHPPAQLA